MLTLAQQRAYKFIKQFIAEHGYAPTVMEVAQGIGIKSKGVAHRYILALQEAGKLVLQQGRHRNIELIDDDSETGSSGGQIPLLGKIAAGSPIEAIAENEVLDVNALFAGENRYALRVQGDSMIDEGIFDEDLVICEHCSAANDGDIVVALVDDGEATLKTLKNNRNGTVSLIPANPNLSTMIFEAERVQIQGRFVGLLRLH